MHPQGEQSEAKQEKIGLDIAYIAMYRFIEAYWERGLRSQGSVTLLCSDMAPYDDPKNPGQFWISDPAFWNDWLQAVEIAREDGPLKNIDPGRS